MYSIIMMLDECINLDWWDGEGDLKGGDVCTPMADSC